ncbi:MAG: DUF3604 domain-containing protein [Polyangiales bacterium]
MGYTLGYPMGSDLKKAPEGKAPGFLMYAVKDPDGANLDRIQIVKGWVDADGKTHERVYDVAWSGDRKRGPDGKVPAVENTVDLATAEYQSTAGAPALKGFCSDPDFDREQPAFYYSVCSRSRRPGIPSTMRWPSGSTRARPGTHRRFRSARTLRRSGTSPEASTRPSHHVKPAP